MKTRRAQTSVSASPVLIGAVTVLIAIIAVFIAYNANSGLPFVPTYDVKAQLPSGAKLVKGNEVRVGGFRVGVVDDIEPDVVVVEGERRSIAVAELKLDKTIEPLPEDSELRVRPRSALGLKYIELSPGTSRKSYARGRHDPARAGLRAARVRGPVLHLRPRDAAEHQGGHRRLRRRLRRARQLAQPRDRRAQPLLPLADPGDGEPLRPGHRARPVLPPDGPRRRSGGAGGAHAGGAVHRHGRHLRRHLAATPRRSSRRSRSARRRWTRRSARSACSARSSPTSPTSRAGCAPRPRSCRARCPRSTSALAAGHAGAAAHGGPERAARGRLRRGGGPVRQPEHAARPARPGHGAAGRAARRSSSSRPTRRSATTSSTSCTRSARCSRWCSRAPPAAARCSTRTSSSSTPSSRTATARQESSRPVGHPRGPGARREPRTRWASTLARFYVAGLPAGHRRPGQRRLPERPERLSERLAGAHPARLRPLQARRHPGQLQRRGPAHAGPDRHAAPTARSRPTTCRGSRAAPTSRASSASTTWRTCHEPLPRRRARAGPDRDLRLLRLHQGQPVREPVRVPRRLQRT